MSKTVAFITLGCKVNQFETELMEGLFKQKDYKVVPNDEKAIDAKRNQISNTVLPVPPEDDKLVTL